MGTHWLLEEQSACRARGGGFVMNLYLIIYEVFIIILGIAYLMKRFDKVDQGLVAILLCGALPLTPFTFVKSVYDSVNENYKIDEFPETLQLTMGDSKVVWKRKPKKDEPATSTVPPAQPQVIATPLTRSIDTVSEDLLKKNIQKTEQSVNTIKKIESKLQTIQNDVSSVKATVKDWRRRKIQTLEVQPKFRITMEK
jgi:hypothetical protein